MNKIMSLSFILRIVISIIYLQTLYFKFTGHPDSVYIFSELGLEPYGRIGVGVIELIVSILLLINKTKLLSIIVSLGIITGAIASHLLVIGITIKEDHGGLFTLAIIIFTLNIVLIYLHKTDFSKILKNKIYLQ